MMNRRNFMKLGAAAVIGGAGGMMYCAAEPYWLLRTVKRIDLAGKRMRRIRILHVSDLHIGNQQQLEFAEKALRQGMSGAPDLVCMTGDFINRRLFNPSGVRALFKRVADWVPVVATLGNHDGGEWVRQHGGYTDPSPVADLLAESGVRVLRNEQMTVTLRGQPVVLVGVDDLWSGTMDISKAFGDGPALGWGPRIVLSHNPDTKEDLKEHRWDLMLCGHTHGGQVKLPGVGRPVLPVKDRRYTHGLYRWDGRQMHISCGVGSSCGVRFNCPPEICLLEIG